MKGEVKIRNLTEKKHNRHLMGHNCGYSIDISEKVCYILTERGRKRPRLPPENEAVMSSRPEDKRRFPRIRIQTPVRYQIRGSPQLRHTVVDNISAGGLSFVNTEFIRPATKLNIEINILSRILNSTGRVSWASPLPHSDRYKLGIEFVELDPIQRHYISDYIDIERGKLLLASERNRE